MKNTFICLSLFALTAIGFGSCQSDKTTTIYLVRHAEKMKDGSKDPSLDEIGIKRAERLSEILKNTELKAIYASPYKRTRQTAQPTADQKNMSILLYDPSKQEEFSKTLVNEYTGSNTLVVGHSNTVPMLVNILIDAESYPQLKDDEYDKLFVVTLYEDGNSDVKMELF